MRNEISAKALPDQSHEVESDHCYFNADKFYCVSCFRQVETHLGGLLLSELTNSPRRRSLQIHGAKISGGSLYQAHLWSFASSLGTVHKGIFFSWVVCRQKNPTVLLYFHQQEIRDSCPGQERRVHISRYQIFIFVNIEESIIKHYLRNLMKMHFCFLNFCGLKRESYFIAPLHQALWILL